MSSRLDQVLHERAGTAPSSTVELGEVHRRAAARQLRRRTAVVSSGALILVLAVVGAGQLAGREAGSAPQPAAPTRTPTGTPTGPPTGAPQPDVRIPALASLSRGAAPAIAYGDGLTRLVLPDGTTFPVPGGRDYLTWTPYDGGVLVTDGDENVRRYDSAGRQVTSWAAASSVAVSSDRRRTAVTRTGAALVGATSGGRLAARTLPGAEDVVSFLPDDALAVNARRAGVLAADGTLTPIPGAAYVLSGSDRTGLVAAGTRDNTYFVADSRTGRTLWRTDLLPLRFSPTGAYVAAQPTPTRPRQVDVVDARTGRILTRVAPPRGYDIRSTAWEGDRTLLMVVENGKVQSLVRVGLDGSAERATAVTSARSTTYVFARQP